MCWLWYSKLMTSVDSTPAYPPCTIFFIVITSWVKSLFSFNLCLFVKKLCILKKLAHTAASIRLISSDLPICIPLFCGDFWSKSVIKYMPLVFSHLVCITHTHTFTHTRAYIAIIITYLERKEHKVVHFLCFIIFTERRTVFFYYIVCHTHKVRCVWADHTWNMNILQSFVIVKVLGRKKSWWDTLCLDHNRYIFLVVRKDF